jgi:hypothetical protein
MSDNSSVTGVVLSCAEYAAAAALNGSAFLPDCDSCLEKLFPCSQTVIGNMMLMIAYGFVLSCGAKLISDGAEMLLEVSNPVIVGGLVLPILGALPDAAMILVSGLGPDAQEQLRSRRVKRLQCNVVTFVSLQRWRGHACRFHHHAAHHPVVGRFAHRALRHRPLRRRNRQEMHQIRLVFSGEKSFSHC